MRVKIMLGVLVLASILSVSVSASKTRAAAPYAATDAFVRVVHASPDAPAVDIYLNGKKTFEGLKFRTIAAYTLVRAGSYAVQGVPAGKTLKEGPVVISTTAVLKADTDNSVIVFGRQAKLAALILTDDNSIDDPTKGKVRFIQLSPDAPAMDVIIPAQSDVRLFSGLTYKSVSEYVAVEPKQYSFVIRPAGGSADVLDVKGLTVEPASVTTIFAFGLWSGVPKLIVGVSQDLRPQIMLPVTGGAGRK